MIKTISFSSHNGNLGKVIDSFLEKKQNIHKENFKLIDIKYSIGEHNMDNYSFEGALLIYEMLEKKEIL